MTLEQLRAFVKVAQVGSFTRAAAALETQKAHLSRTVAQLERELHVRLLARTTRSVRLTEVGREVFERAQSILAEVAETERIAEVTRGAPRGQLRLSCGVEFGMLAVSGWIDGYLAANPEVTVEADFSSRVVELVEEGFDLAIRVGPLDDSRIAARRLGDLRYGLFACPRYLAERGVPKAPDALKSHALVVFSAGSHRAGWRLRCGADEARVSGRGRLVVNNSFAVRDALLKSLGVGQLPLVIAAEHVRRKRLVRVLPEWEPIPAPVNAVFPSNRFLAPKVRAFIDHAVAHFPRQ